MAWTAPANSRGAVDRAGKVFNRADATPADRAAAREVINNWRSSHGFPLNTLQMSLRRKARTVNPDALIAQRSKRLPSILAKLSREPRMALSQMHDLGGARAVMATVEEARSVEAAFMSASHKHELSRHDDYIANPKPSGYRGIHLVYKYRSDKSATYNGHRIELQLRSQLMHAWATAVETVGTFTQQSLKSSRGDEDFLRFFVLMSAALAHEEDQPFPPGAPAEITLVHDELRRLAADLSVIERMEGYRDGFRQIEAVAARGAYSLLQLDIATSVLTVSTYATLDEATAAFDAAEGAISENSHSSAPQDAVLVSVDSIHSLRTAYPNYFLDTSVFLSRLQRIVDHAV